MAFGNFNYIVFLHRLASQDFLSNRSYGSSLSSEDSLLFIKNENY